MRVDPDSVAQHIREVAAEVIMPRWRNLAHHEVSHKTSPTDLVTIADKEAEIALAKRLTALVPGSFVVGEEGVSADPSILSRLGTDQVIWVIDPIDGTKAFAGGDDDFDVMVALVRGNERIAGWIYAPVDDDFYLGERGGGVVRRSRGMPAAVTRAATIPATEMTGLLGWKTLNRTRDRERAAGRKFFKELKAMQCCGHDYARILRGEAHFVLYNRARPWDHLPGLTLLEEMGFVSLKHNASRYDVGDVDSGGLLTAPTETAWHGLRQLLLD